MPLKELLETVAFEDIWKEMDKEIFMERSIQSRAGVFSNEDTPALLDIGGSWRFILLMF